MMGTKESDPGLLQSEHDACALIASVRKTGAATHGNVNRIISALSKMGHRCGEVNGEGDGCGLLTDIPRKLWADALEEVGKPAWLSEDRRFFVGHFMIPACLRSEAETIQATILNLIAQSNAELLLERPGQTRNLALGRLARQEEPLFWQVAGVMEKCPLEDVERNLFDLALLIEKTTQVHVASLSSFSVVYKVRGAVETLYHYYPELRSRRYMSAISLGHARFSTNTTTSFERVQPFSLLGHNGEINTIVRLREQGRMLGVQTVMGGSDSQDLDRTLATFIHRYGFSLAEAIEFIFPPILSEMANLQKDLQFVYQYMRQAFGPFAQGPAAIIARCGEECAFSVDAMGLRPLWFAETEKEFVFSSEKGVLPLDFLCNDPRPFSPGEKMCVQIYRNEGVKVLDYSETQQKLLKFAKLRFSSLEAMRNKFYGPFETSDVNGMEMVKKHDGSSSQNSGFTSHERLFSHPVYELHQRERWMAALGWGRDDREWVQSLGQSGHDPIGSLGYDGPLAAFSRDRQNIADFCKEFVAVVTNPSVDQQREIEHFSTQCILGPRPELIPEALKPAKRLCLDFPVIAGGHPGYSSLTESACQQVASDSGTMCLEEVIAFFSETTTHLMAVTKHGECVRDAVMRLSQEAVSAVQSGSQCLLLDDALAFGEGRGWLDPLLAVAAVDRALQQESHANLRRHTGVILRSGAIRNLHDLIIALGLGADAVAPYLLLEVAVHSRASQNGMDPTTMLNNTLSALRNGLEKVISTMGIHELRGYGRLFAGIGLSQPIAELLGIMNYCGSERRGLTWEDLDDELSARNQIFSDNNGARLKQITHIYPRIWKAAGQLAQGQLDADSFEDRVASIEKENPTALRHSIGFRIHDSESGNGKSEHKSQTSPMTAVRSSEVDTGLTGHDLPFVIGSMSFGSQGEVAFRAYVEAASRLNMIALSGEGGEIVDLMGRYPHNRGLQIASGRFGINVDLLNSANLLEIKVGQGAKPGEGGHLPGRKVSTKVAAARHTQPGVDLISPSNNHDIYSIEDLAQFIEELKTANPKARVAVKVPVVPGIGIIAVGIVKAGADIVNLSGFDGGTGAARKHSIQHVGLPAEIGVVEVHRELVESGLRPSVELWCDGGMRSAADVVKMICLGANRVGFGTMAMVAIGCTICRLCQTDRCHVGIATQIEQAAQAQARGLKHFQPREYDQAVNNLVSFFQALGERVREITADLGFYRTQDLVGRADLLEQVSHHAELDFTDLLTPVQIYKREVFVSSMQDTGQRSLRRPRNHLTTVISNLVMETALNGEDEISFEDDKVTPVDRALGTHLAGALTRFRQDWLWQPGHGGVGGMRESWRQPVNGVNGDGNHVREAHLRFYSSSVPGNGLGAYNTHPIYISVEGGAQDGVAKCMCGGKVIVLKGYNNDGELVDGSVGKSLAYGATGGLVIVQGNADSRACIRLSGADVIIGGEIEQPLNDHLGFIGARANVKGFLCEYMTAGRVLVLGDPGPWICAGMTGGVLYLHLQPYKNFDREAIYRRIARGAKVFLKNVDDEDEASLHELLTAYANELERGHQSIQAQRCLDLFKNWREIFVKIEPVAQQVNQELSQE